MTEQEKSKCEGVDEAAMASSIVEGPPGDTCEVRKSSKSEK